MLTLPKLTARILAWMALDQTTTKGLAMSEIIEILRLFALLCIAIAGVCFIIAGIKLIK